MHGLDHALQDRVQQLSGLFGIAVSQQLHGAFEIGEQHRDLLALAFQGGAGSQDLLREMRGGVCLGSLGPRCER
jgi:hypothetical protein